MGVMDRIPSIESPIDQSILKCLFEDPKTGWDSFWQTYGPVIQAGIGRFRLSSEDTEDILQDVCERLFRDNFHLLRLWDPQRSSLATFLSVVVRSQCIDHLRSSFFKYTQKKHRIGPGAEEATDPLNLLEDCGEDPSEFVHRIQMSDILNQALEDLARQNHLKPLDRQVLVLRASGEKYKRIAELLGISESNAMTRFSRTKQELLRYLNGKKIEPADTGRQNLGKKIVRFH